jgi:hypothetical protein
MHLTFDTRLRLPFPQPRNLALQSLYVFNLYRAGSSVVEAAAESLALISGRTANNLTRTFYSSGTELIDSQIYGRPLSYLADEGASLLRICEVGGWLNYGFREVPPGFAAGFSHVGAAVLIVRDPRDIGISHYHALARHDDTNQVYGEHVRQARAAAADKDLAEYLLSDELIGFLVRICESYRPIIARGVSVVQYEQLFLDGQFDVGLLCNALFDVFAAFRDARWRDDAFLANTRARIANSKSLQGHATAGTVAMYMDLPPQLRAAYSARLKSQLDLFGY